MTLKSEAKRELKRQKARQRILRLLSERSWHVEWSQVERYPHNNFALLKVVEDGEAALGEPYKEQWGGREHTVYTLSITPVGRAVIQ